jgi:CRISPR-associated protein Cmr1
VLCPEDSKKKPTDPGHHCVVCELFGCTGWARKFRLIVVNEKGQVIQGQIRANTTFILRFIPLRPIKLEEWCLLDATLRLIADYGAIGGKTVFKPSDDWGIADLGSDDLDDSSGKVKRANGIQEIPVWAGKRHHQDLGLISIEQYPSDIRCNRQKVEAYVRNHPWRSNFDDDDFSWASLQNFWCVRGRYLVRQDANTSSFNFVIGRPEPKGQSSQGDSWLAGRRPDRQRNIEPESKKVLSFKNPENARRTFGFVQNEQEFSQILQRLETLRDGGAPRNQPDQVWLAWLPRYKQKEGLVWEREDGETLSDRSFRQRLLITQPGTAINPSSDTAEEGTLRELELISPRWRSSAEAASLQPVGLMGYVFCQSSEVWPQLQAVEELFIGGDTRYGLGQLTRERRKEPERADRLFGSPVSLSSNHPVVHARYALAHVEVQAKDPVQGALECLQGWDSLDGGTTGSGMTWVPGSEFMKEADCAITEQGLWRL